MCFALQYAIYIFCFYVSVVRVSVQQMLLIVTVASIVFDKICTSFKPCCESTSACPMYILGQSNSLSGVFYLDWTYLFVVLVFSIFQNVFLVSNENIMLVSLNSYVMNLPLFSSVCEL